MKVIRLLVYEGSEEALEKHLSQTYVRPDGLWNGNAVDGSRSGGIAIKEIFRGEQKDSEVVHLDDDIPF